MEGVAYDLSVTCSWHARPAPGGLPYRAPAPMEEEPAASCRRLLGPRTRRAARKTVDPASAMGRRVDLRSEMRLRSWDRAGSRGAPCRFDDAVSSTCG